MKKTVFIFTIASVLGLTIFKLAPNKIVKQSINDTSIPKEESLNTDDTIHPFSIKALSQREYPSDGFVSQQSVGENEIYRSYIAGYLSEGLTQYALLHLPKKQNEKIPVVIVNHGYIDPDVYSTVNSYQNTDRRPKPHTYSYQNANSTTSFRFFRPGDDRKGLPGS